MTYQQVELFAELFNDLATSPEPGSNLPSIYTAKTGCKNPPHLSDEWAKTNAAAVASFQDALHRATKGAGVAWNATHLFQFQEYADSQNAAYALALAGETPIERAVIYRMNSRRRRLWDIFEWLKLYEGIDPADDLRKIGIYLEKFYPEALIRPSTHFVEDSNR